MMDAADVDGNGQIEFPEFVLIMGKRVLEEDGRVELECAFRLLAQQGSGLVKVEDVKALLTTAGQPFTAEEAAAFHSTLSHLSSDVLTRDQFFSLDCWKLPELHSGPTGELAAPSSPPSPASRSLPPSPTPPAFSDAARTGFGSAQRLPSLPPEMTRHHSFIEPARLPPPPWMTRPPP